MRWSGKSLAVAGGLIICLVASMMVSLVCGQIDVPIDKAVAVLGYQLGMPNFEVTDFTAEQQAVLWHIRLPRILVGMLVGAGLATAGAVMQGVFSNPLADPGIIGVTSGAAMGAVVSIALGWSAVSLYAMPVCALVGAVLAVSVTVLLSMRRGKVPVVTLLLSGIAVGMLLGALTSGILICVDEQKLQQYLFWMVGGLDYRRWEHVIMAAVPVLGGIGIMWTLARHLNILVLGETEARAVGMAVMPFRLGLLFLASLVTATSVCVSGSIGFVGLVVPHMMRMIVGPDHRVLIPTSALAGAFLLVLCDTVGRMVVEPTEIRVGIMTALLGTPYFLYLLRRMQDR